MPDSLRFSTMAQYAGPVRLLHHLPVAIMTKKVPMQKRHMKAAAIKVFCNPVLSTHGVIP